MVWHKYKQEHDGIDISSIFFKVAHWKTNILQNPLHEAAVPSLSDMESELLCENEKKLTDLDF